MGLIESTTKHLIGIRELSEPIAQDSFNNNFSLYNGTQAMNITPLDEVGKGQTVSTCHALHFYSSISPSAVSITISDINQYSAS